MSPGRHSEWLGKVPYRYSDVDFLSRQHATRVYIEKWYCHRLECIKGRAPPNARGSRDSHLSYRFKNLGYRKYSMTDVFAKSITGLSAYFPRTKGLVCSNKAPELKDNAWILWKQEHKIWLPPEYRPRIFSTESLLMECIDRSVHSNC